MVRARQSGTEGRRRSGDHRSDPQRRSAQNPAGASGDLQIRVELNGTHNVTDRTFEAVVSRFGTRGAMDLIGINGHYSMISMILNVAQVPTPDGTVPLQPLTHKR